MRRCKFGLCVGVVFAVAAPLWADGHLPLIVSGEGPPTESLSLLHDYSDEFGGNELNTSKWSTDSPPYAGATWNADNVTVADGVLRLTARNQPKRVQGKFFPYSAGRVSTKAAPIQYGYFESRLKAAPLFPGVCPAFWAFRRDETAGIWTEIDFIELTQASYGSIGSPRRLDATLHVFNFRGRPEITPRSQIEDQQYYTADFDPREDFHVYGCWWTKNAVSWYLDGKRIFHRDQNRYWHQPLDLLCTIEIRPPLENEPTPKGFPTTAEFDYVRVWKVSDEPKSN
ncbi:MAG TPA: family 16 glycosylhydrolase [Pirellulales bacterium]|nr:family 16 glycosylhydrolase [Pirellulales bacterium]